MTRLGRFALLVVTCAGALAVLYARFSGRTAVQIDRFTLPIDKRGLPPDGITILHLSDLHYRAASRTQTHKIERLHRLLSGKPYDLLALTGDLIHDKAGLPAALALVESLQPRIGSFSCPGNHDYRESGFRAMLESRDTTRSWSPWRKIAETVRGFWHFGLKVIRNQRTDLPVAYHDVPAMHTALASRGVLPLVNRSFHIEGDGIDLWVAGVDDLTQGTPDLSAALAGIPEDALVIALAHNPDVWLDPLVGRADLVLSGHTHGGQLRLPLIGAIYTQGTHLPRHRPAGWFHRGTAHMFVSRGLGESFPLRFRSPPQAALIRLAPGNTGA